MTKGFLKKEKKKKTVVPNKDKVASQKIKYTCIQV